MNQAQPAFECPNSKCRSTNLVMIGRDPKNKNRSGVQQLIYQCRDCGWKVGEISLERRLTKRSLDDYRR
jgi:hypothetical protein